MSQFHDLDRRSREVFQKLVEYYIESGGPIGSKNLADGLSERLSPATVRNVMADLEALGLLGSPHISAGRLPTELGLRFFVDGILEFKTLSERDRREIDRAVREHNDGPEAGVYERTGTILSQIAQSASLVFAKKQDSTVRHIDFVSLSDNQALVILVTDDGAVDNRLFTPPPGLTQSDMRRAANFINAQIQGRSLSELQGILESAIQAQSREIDAMMARLIAEGKTALIEGRGRSQLVVRGRSHLLQGEVETAELEQLRGLLDDLENKRDLVELLELADNASAVRVFIGSENKLFSLKSSSLVISPYMNGEGEIVGAVGVIGPTRLNYARVVPMVTYTAGLMGKLKEKEE